MYAERLNPKDKFQYWFKGAWKDMDHHTETVPVKGGQPVTHDVAWTVHGPVLQWDLAHGVAYSERSAEQGHELDNWVAVTEMGRAKDLADFQSDGVDRIAYGASRGPATRTPTASTPSGKPGASRSGPPMSIPGCRCRGRGSTSGRGS